MSDGTHTLALEYDFRPWRWLGVRALDGRGMPGAVLACSGLRPRRVRLVKPPGSGWLRLSMRLAGICGTDLAALRARLGPELSPFVSFPAVLGHEVLAQPEEGPWRGRRVVLDPFLGCRVRGLPLCPTCAAGRTALCHRFAEGRLAPGMLLGFCRDLPGGWSHRLLAHESQLHPVPEAVSDERAVLAEPLAVALHAALPQPPVAGERVLVLGAGTIGLCVLAALALLGSPAEVVVVARYRHQAALARRLGAGHVVPDPAGAERLATERGWARGFSGLWGVRSLTGGFDQVYDSVGSVRTLTAALRLARAGGRVALLGGAARARLDLAPFWTREVRLDGCCGYGSEPRPDGTIHTLDLALHLLATRPDVPLEALVTHRFPLRAWRGALWTGLNHGRSGAVKVVFSPGDG